MKSVVNDYLRKLQQSGYKATNQRRDILKALVENKDSHLSCEEVHKIVSEHDNEVGIATVYRALMLFERLGIVYKINFDDGVSRYEANLKEESHHHHHLICKKCGRVTEVKLDLLEALEDEIQKEESFLIENHNLKFYGICKECIKNKN